MNGEEFVKLCYNEKESLLHEYFNTENTDVSKKVQALIKSGTDKNALFDIINSVMTENYYTLLLALDGAASIGGNQTAYKLYDENGNLLNKCGEIESAAYEYFMES